MSLVVERAVQRIEDASTHRPLDEEEEMEESAVQDQQQQLIVSPHHVAKVLRAIDWGAITNTARLERGIKSTATAIERAKDRHACALPGNMFWKVFQTPDGRRVFRTVSLPEIGEEEVVFRITGSQARRRAPVKQEQPQQGPAAPSRQQQRQSQVAYMGATEAEGKTAVAAAVPRPVDVEQTEFNGTNTIIMPASAADITKFQGMLNRMEPGTKEDSLRLATSRQDDPMKPMMRTHRVVSLAIGGDGIEDHASTYVAISDRNTAGWLGQSNIMSIKPGPVKLHTMLNIMQHANPAIRDLYRKALRASAERMVTAHRPAFISVDRAFWDAWVSQKKAEWQLAEAQQNGSNVPGGPSTDDKADTATATATAVVVNEEKQDFHRTALMMARKSELRAMLKSADQSCQGTKAELVNQCMSLKLRHPNPEASQLQRLASFFMDELVMAIGGDAYELPIRGPRYMAVNPIVTPFSTFKAMLHAPRRFKNVSFAAKSLGATEVRMYSKIKSNKAQPTK